MDPGPWSPYTYNGLSATGVASASGTFATAAGQRAVADLQAMGSQPGASQLLQLAGMSPAAAVAAAANSSFLSSNYEPVFTSLFHHSAAQKSQYGALNVAHHRQPLGKPGDSELTAALRDNYMHQSVATSTAAALYEQTSPLNWSQASTSLGSPFGVLPHESVSGSSKSSSPDKKSHIFSEGSTPPYENTFSAHLSPPFAHGYTNPQLAAAADFRSSSNPANFEAKKVQKSTSHDSKPSTASWQGAFSQVTPTSVRECSSLPPPPSTSFAQSHAQKAQIASNFASRAAAAVVASTATAATAHQQQTSQTCIVSRPSHHQVPPNLPFVPQHRPSSVPAPMAQEKTVSRSTGFSPKSNTSHVPTKAQSKIFPSGPLDASVNSTVPLESSQSPRYGLDTNHNFSSSTATAAAASKGTSIPQAHQRVPYPNPTAAHMVQYRNFPSPDAAAVSHASEYQRSTPDSIALSPYSDSEPQHCHTQNGGSSSSSGLGRPSPTQTSPLSHTPSPAYPIYNSPMSAPSPLHETPSCVYSKPTPQQQSSGYPSVIQCNSTPAEVKQAVHARQNFPHGMKQTWEMQEKLARSVRDMSQSNAGIARFPYATESVDVLDEGMLAGSEGLPPQHRQSMYEPGSTINMQDLAGPSNEELLARGVSEADVEEYDRRRGRKVKRRKSGEKAKQPQNCGYPLQNGYFPTAYHENYLARNTIGGYHPRLGFNPAHMHGQPAPAHSQCGPNPMYHQMGPLPLSMQQQGPSTSTASPPTPPHALSEKPPLLGPSVDDELSFLEESGQVVPPQPVQNPMQRPGSSKDGTGFMDSYLKFLRGETETPLTISVRAGRKSPKVADTPRRNSTTSRNVTSSVQKNQGSKAASQNVTTATSDKPCLPYQQNITPGLSSNNSCDQDPNKKTVQNQPQDCVPVSLAANVRQQQQQQADMPSCLLEEKRTSKEVGVEPSSVLINADMRSRVDARAREDLNLQRGRGRPPKRSAPVQQEEVPEELSTRKFSGIKAEQGMMASRGHFEDNSDDDDDDDPDSETDPAWTPPVDETPSSTKKSPCIRQGQNSASSPTKCEAAKKRTVGRRSKYSDSDDDDSPDDGGARTVRSDSDREYLDRKKNRRSRKQLSSKRDSTYKKRKSVEPDSSENAYKKFVSGAFIILKDDVGKERPNIWRIDGRSLIQKFESFEEDGRIYYRNVSTYSGWTSDSHIKYEVIKVFFMKHERNDTVIYISDDNKARSLEVMKKKFMAELDHYLDPFRTYLQTLVSQALDENFIPVVLTENDEYFVTSLIKIDNTIEKKRSNLRNVMQLHGNTEDLITNFPTFTSIELSNAENTPTCATCASASSVAVLKFAEERYDPVALTIVAADDDPGSREFPICNICEPYIELYSRLLHLKFYYYKLCVGEVQKVRQENPTITTDELLRIVLNAEWVEKLFHELQEFLAKIDYIVYASMNATPSSECTTDDD